MAHGPMPNAMMPNPHVHLPVQSLGCRTLALPTLLTVGNLQFAQKSLAHKAEFVNKVCRLYNLLVITRLQKLAYYW
jgi:hypothetical protein